MDVFVDRKPLLSLVSSAQSGKIVLPEFQRDFVWSREAVRDLLTSILMNYYIGSLLLLRTDDSHLPFEARPIAGVRVTQRIAPEFMVLDGQQRMTSLHYAFAAPGISLKDTKRPYRYFLDLNKVKDPDAIEDAIFYEREDKCEPLLDREYQYTHFVVPFTALLSFEDWLTDCDNWYYKTDRDKYEQIFRPARQEWRDAVSRFEKFMVPTNEIEKVSPTDIPRIAKVCAIFEKLNSTGVALSVFDLLTARLFPFQIRLRDLWDEAYKASPLIQEYAADDIYGNQVLLLRTVGLMRGMDVKAKKLIELGPENFEADWYEAVTAMEMALKRVGSTNQDGFGAFSPKWLPYSTMLPVLAAALYYIKKHKLGDDTYSAVRKWYWGSVFLERYAGAVESTTYRDYSDLIERFKNHSHEPVAFREINDQLLNNPKFSLAGEARANAPYRGAMSLIAIRGAKDFRTGDSIDFHTLNDHHVFPDAKLKRMKDENKKPFYTGDQINVILNRTLISEDTNQLIKDSSPSDYIASLVPARKKAAIMESHFIDASALKAAERDSYGEFTRAREVAILGYLRGLLTES